MGWRTVCCACEAFNRSERHRRVALHRERWQQQDAWEEHRRQECQRKVTLRQVYEQQWREREHWYRQQPDRCCRTCGELLPASAFGGVSSANGFTLHTRCTHCHAALRERHQCVCCLCEQRKPRREFLAHYSGYALWDSGARLSLCCQACEAAFRALPDDQQWSNIQSCCQRTFPVGQVIYAEIDPETGDRRYIGRTGRPQRRHAQHLDDASPITGRWGTQRTTWYTRRNWMYALAEKGLAPSMQILQTIEVSPLVLEWEQRYIWHGMQQGWRLLNVETMDEELVERVRTSSVHFLEAPFAQLVRQSFFPSHGLVALLHMWYHSERVRE